MKCQCRMCQPLASSKCHPRSAHLSVPSPSHDSQSELSGTVRCAYNRLLSMCCSLLRTLPCADTSQARGEAEIVPSRHSQVVNAGCKICKALLSMLQSTPDTSLQGYSCTAARRDPIQRECNVSDAHANESIPWHLKAFAVLSNITVMSKMVRVQCDVTFQGLQLPVRQQHVLALTQRLQGLAACQCGGAELDRRIGRACQRAL